MSSDQKDNPKYPTITRAELAGGYFNKHVAFVIRTPSGSEIKRRYTDFEWLRHLLCLLYPGAFIPPIPPKLPVAMWPQGYLLMRKRELQQFLQRLEVIPYLKKEEVTLFFLTNHGTNPFDKERKKWEKQHPKPSDKQLFEKLSQTFPKIHETKTPQDMEKRCRQSRKLINESIKQLEIMVKSSESFITVTKECCDCINEFRSYFDDLLRIEYDYDEHKSNKYIKEKRIDISPYICQWKMYKMDEANNMNIFYIPTLNRALNDLRVIREILNSRDKIQADYVEAKRKASVWHNASGGGGGDGGGGGGVKAVRSSDLAKKHREVQREEDLRNLRDFVDKLVLGQLNVVFCANTRRWKKSCNLFADKHLIALEKMVGSWKDLTNKILKNKGNTDGIFKAVNIETIDDEDAYDDDDDEEDENKNNISINEKKIAKNEKNEENDVIDNTAKSEKTVSDNTVKIAKNDENDENKQNVANKENNENEDNENEENEQNDNQ